MARKRTVLAPNRRSRLSPNVEADLMWQSDRVCCICHEERKGVQVHHVDGRRAGDGFENLALLCHEHHEEASKTTSLTKKLSAVVVRRYRDEWYSEVQERRNARRRPSIPGSESTSQEDFLDCLAIMEVRKLGPSSGPYGGMNEVIQRIRLLGQYSWGYGLRVRLEVLYAIESLIAGRWRHGARLEDLTSAAHIVIVETLPLPPWIEKRTEQLNPAEREIVDTALRLGFEISANAAHVLESLPSVDDGADVMAKILRHAVIVQDESLKVAAIEQFRQAMDGAFADGRRWLEFAMNNALRPIGSARLQMSQELAEKMWPSR
jgi:hypothetical protein